ncbi:MAG: alkaline phosphatase [Planctomycetota bacterium]
MRPRVVIGAGHPDPQGDGHANHQYCPAPVYASLVDGSAGYRFVESDGEQGADARLLDAADQAAASDASLFGLFGSAATATDPGSHFAPPVPVHAPGAPAFERDGRDPSLATCTEAAMRVLARDPEGFVLMVEGGDIDWANHGDRSTWMIGAWQQMDEAIHRAQALVESRSCGGMTPENTLLIVVSDHGNGLLRLREPYDLPAGSLPSAGQYAIGEDLFHAMDGSGAIVADPDLRYPNAPGFDPRDPSTWFGGHTNELVTCHAWGAGIGHLQAYQDDWYGAQTPLLDHTHVFQAMADFLGLDPGHDGPQPVLTGGD